MKKKLLFGAALLFLAAFLLFALFSGGPAGKAKVSAGPPRFNNGIPVLAQEQFAYGNGQLEVCMIDVGQGDSILIKTPMDRIILIDTGEYAAKSALTRTLRKNGIKKIDLLVESHAHTDHMGYMKNIVRDYEIGQILMPRAGSDTPAYEKLLTAIRKKGLTITTARAGRRIDLESDLEIEVLGPIDEAPEELNNSSVILRVAYGKTSFLFTGDAEQEELSAIMAKTPEKLNADVLKAAHHGSSGSLPPAFLEAVSPEYAMISCGIGNSYGHPHKEALMLLDEAGVLIFRTDRLGNILAVSDGSTVFFNRTGERFAVDPSVTVYRTASGKTYHKRDCQVIAASEISAIRLGEAREQGLTPCRKCFR